MSEDPTTPHPQDPDDHPHLVTRNARIGLALFVVYVILYVGFMFLAAFRPEIMSTRPFRGANLAVLYGFGLIPAALVLALIYTFLTKRRDPTPPPS